MRKISMLAGPGAYARAIPNELLVKIMNDQRSGRTFWIFVTSTTVIRLSAECIRTIYLPKEIFQMSKEVKPLFAK